MIDLLQIINNVVAMLPSLQTLFMILSWLMGAIFIMMAVKAASKRSEMGRNSGSWSAPMWQFIIGVCFIALPGLLAGLTLTFFNQAIPDASSIFAYAPATVGMMEDEGVARTMIEGITSIVMFVGIIAVMRGLHLLNQTAQGGGGGPKTFGPGITFVIAGIMAVNFPLFVGMMELLITTPAA